MSKCVDWTKVSDDWPKVILLKNVEQLASYPWSRRYTRNFCCGKTADPTLKKHLFRVGAQLAVERGPLADFLQRRTRREE